MSGAWLTTKTDITESGAIMTRTEDAMDDADVMVENVAGGAEIKIEREKEDVKIDTDDEEEVEDPEDEEREDVEEEQVWLEEDDAAVGVSPWASGSGVMRFFSQPVEVYLAPTGMKIHCALRQFGELCKSARKGNSGYRVCT